MIDYQKLELDAPEGWFSVYDMEVLGAEVAKLKPGSSYFEIGVHKGRSLWVAKKIAQEGVRIYGIDIEKDPKIPGTIFVKADSRKIPDKLRGLNFSLIFIDGDHTYEGCRADIKTWYPRVEKGGTILFHDCDETSIGVMRAVTEFVGTHLKEIEKFELYKRTDKNTSMAIIKLKND